MKRKLIRIAAVLLLLLAGLGLGVFGKGYTLILDSSPLVAGGASIDPPAAADIVVDGGKEIRILAGERDKTDVKGPFHTIELRIMEGTSKAAGTVRRDFKLGAGRTYILSLAALAGGLDSFVEKFTESAAAPPAAAGGAGADKERESPAGAELPKL